MQNKGSIYCSYRKQNFNENEIFIVNYLSEKINFDENKKNLKNFIQGPWRVKPGGLSVSRSFGDVDSKIKFFGGTEGTVICEPDFYKIETNDLDFILMGSDGIFDKSENMNLISLIWKKL